MSSRIRKVFEIFPKLGSHLHKGDCGRIACVGGSPEYTGAPYFASLVSMKIGADLAYLFTHPDASPVIKSYSPELIVHPGQEFERIEAIIERIDSLIIGPGLGRDSKLVPLIKNLLKRAKESDKLGVVIDADGLFLVADCLDELKNSCRVILTPNHNEFKRLYQKVLDKKLDQDAEITQDQVKELSTKLGGVNVFCKGNNDIITNGTDVLIGNEEGCQRRCGGQGDLLSGTIALFIYWQRLKNKSDSLKSSHILNGALCASDFIRYTSKYTFEKIGRSMNASDILENVRYVVQEFDKSCQ